MSGNRAEPSVQLDLSSTESNSDRAERSPDVGPTTEDQIHSPTESEHTTTMGQCLCRDRKQAEFPDELQTESMSMVPYPRGERQRPDDTQHEKTFLANACQTEEANKEEHRLTSHKDPEEPEEQFQAGSDGTPFGATLLKKQVTNLSDGQSCHLEEEGEQIREGAHRQPQQSDLRNAVPSEETMDVIGPNIDGHSQQQNNEGRITHQNNLSRQGEDGGQAANYVRTNTTEISESSSHSTSAITASHEQQQEENISPTGVEDDSRIRSDQPDHISLEETQTGPAEPIESQENEETDNARYFGEPFQGSPIPYGHKVCLVGSAVHKLLANAPPSLSDHPFVSLIREVTEIDILYPNTIDGPELRVFAHFKTDGLRDVIVLAFPKLRVLRLPRLRKGDSINLEELFSVIGQNSSLLKELVFEDGGIISAEIAKLLFETNNLEKLEVYAPAVPLLSALILARHQPKVVCFHALTPDLEKDMGRFLRMHGYSLKSLCLGFKLSVKKTTAEHRRFWANTASLLGYLVPTLLSQLETLELSSSQPYEVTHRFPSSESDGSCRDTEKALRSIERCIHTKNGIRHPKESLISLTKVKLTGSEEAVSDALNRLSWVNQGRMEVQFVIPGAHAVFQRGYGELTPVILQSVQLDQFIFNGMSSPWLDVTSLKEIDIGEAAFVRRYNSDITSVKEATRRLLVTSRESLTRVRAYYRIPSRRIVTETAKILGEIIALLPYVSCFELSRDIVMFAAVGDKEYVDTLMMLRMWNLKTLHLHSERHYDHSREEANLSGEASPNEGVNSPFTEFLKRLPAFLTIVAMACPRLENLVLEWEEMDNGLDMEIKRELITCVLKAIDVYETTVPTVNTATLRWLVHEWYGSLSKR